MFSKTQRGVLPLLIIARGSSAGASKALQHLLRNYTSHLFHSCIILAQHRSENHKTMLGQLLAKKTWVQVIEGQQRLVLDANFYFQKPARLTQNFQIIESVVQTWASNKNNG